MMRLFYIIRLLLFRMMRAE